MRTGSRHIKRGTGFLIVEHNLPALARLASRLLVMDRGRLIADDTPGAVLADRIVQDGLIEMHDTTVVKAAKQETSF